MIYKLYSDGGSRGNPGEAACGCVLFKNEKKLVDFDAKYLGIVTNNQSEYLGLIMGLNLAVKHGVKELEVYLDSELAVKQMNGIYKIKNENIKKYKKEIDTILPKFDKIEFRHIRREFNTHADKILNIVLDNR